MVARTPSVRAGETYALAPSEPGRPLRPVTAIRTQGSYLIYAGPAGAEWAADLSRVPGPWDAHAQAAGHAAAAARELRACLICQAASVAETGYCDFRIRVILTITQTAQAVQQLGGTA